MTDPFDSIVRELREAVALLADIDHPAMTRAGFVLSRCLAGEPFHSASGLPTDFPWRLRIAARDEALTALVAMRRDLSARRLAAWITKERARSGAIRRDGVLGYVDDLVRSHCDLGERHLRRLINSLRDLGHQRPCNGPDKRAPSAATRRRLGKAKRNRRAG